MVTDIRQMTVEEYLAYDEGCEFTNEYIDGEIIPMTGGTGNHGALIAYTIIALANAIRRHGLCGARKYHARQNR